MHEDIVDLQTRMVFQDGVIEQLNQVVTDQQQQIDRLERRMEKLLGQVEALQADQLIQQANEPPPPHY